MPAGVDEATWNRAKSQAEKQGKGKNWAYVMSIYQSMSGEKMAGLKKLAYLVVSWGGRHKSKWGPLGNFPVQPSVGYSNAYGIVPLPEIALRFGHPDHYGMSIGTTGLGLSNRGSESFSERPYPPGLLDLLINSIEDKKNAANEAALTKEGSFMNTPILDSIRKMAASEGGAKTGRGGEHVERAGLPPEQKFIRSLAAAPSPMADAIRK